MVSSPGSCYCYLPICLCSGWMDYSILSHSQCVDSDVAPKWVQPWVCPQSLWNDSGFGGLLFDCLFPWLHPSIKLHWLLATYYFQQHAMTYICSQTEPIKFGLIWRDSCEVNVWDLFWPQKGSFQVSLSLILSGKLARLQFSLSL